jgi:uncharacterized Rmd1/YagE family protein
MAEGELGPSRDSELTARAVLVGLRIDTHGLEHWPSLRVGLITRGDGRVIIFPFGVVVFIGTEPADDEAIITELGKRIRGALADRESEEVKLRFDPAATRLLDASGCVLVPELSEEGFAAVAGVLAKSVVLEHYEIQAGAAMGRVERLAERG